MSTGLPSDEVAEDYKNALDDLVSNDRYQIANLTMIAKENIEHAEAISRVLMNHINRTSPSRKLPALYVLDSLVKNIGSPYTVYFGRNLHSTFMLAYSQVDAGIRRKLEEMLRTWREPIPGSLSTTPVFPLQSTQSIVDTLSKYRASAAPLSQRPQVSAPTHVRPLSAQAYRNTPTPPQQQPVAHIPMATSVAPVSVSEFGFLNANPPIQSYSTPPPQLQSGYGLAPQTNNRNKIDLSELHANIDDLTTDAKIECATHPMDSAAQRKLATLQTLKELLETGSTSEQDLIDIRNTIKHEMEKKTAAAIPGPVAMMSNVPVANPYISQPSIQQPPLSAVPPPPSFINQANLADLLRVTANIHSTPQPSTMYSSLQQTPQPSIYNPPPAAPHGSTDASTPLPSAVPVSALPLLAQLQASGLFSGTPVPSNNLPMPLPASISDLHANIPLTSASLRVQRPHVVTRYLDERRNQCSTCGRRFTSDEGGKERKARHLDWHFRTKARMLEAEQRGQNRSWYVDEREWISSRDIEDDVDIDNANSSSAVLSSAEKAKRQDYVRAPTDPTLRNAPCPIDQEPFKSEWSEEVQDFIWKDAIRVGQRYYHASCYREATRDRGGKDGGASGGASMSNVMSNGSSIRTATPDSVLGKRKAEVGRDFQSPSTVSDMQQYNIEGSANSKVKLES